MHTVTPNEMLGLAAAFTYARRYRTPEETTALALRLVRADMGWPTLARRLTYIKGTCWSFPLAVDAARAWLRTAAEIIEGANSLRGAA